MESRITEKVYGREVFNAFWQSRRIGRTIANSLIDIPDHVIVCWCDCFSQCVSDILSKNFTGYEETVLKQLSDDWIGEDEDDRMVICGYVPSKVGVPASLGIVMLQPFNGWLGHWAFASTRVATMLLAGKRGKYKYTADVAEFVFRFIHESWHEYKKSKTWKEHENLDWTKDEQKEICIGLNHY